MPTDPVRVLLVEDDPEDYRVARSLFAAADHTRFKVDWAATYEAGLDAMARQEHDVYLLDYRLGAHTGVELLRAARDRGWPQPVVMLTGQGDRETDLEAMRGGADDYLNKGHISAELLERCVRYALARAAAAQALRESELRLRAVFEAARDALLIVDSEGHYCLEANPAACALFGLPRDGMIGRTLESFAAPGAEPQPVWHATAVGSQVKGEMGLVRHDGAHRRVEFLVTPDFLPGYDLAVLRDLADGPPRPEPQPHAPARAEVALPDRQDAPDLNRLLASLGEPLLRLLGEGVELVLAFDPSPKPFAADAGAVAQAVFALAARGRDAMSGKGKLTLQTYTVDATESGPRPHPQLRPGRYVLLQMRDTGRAAGPGEEASGMAAACDLVRQLGGVVAVYGEPEVGTSCAVYLPCSAEATTSQPGLQGPHVTAPRARQGFFGSVLRRWFGG